MLTHRLFADLAEVCWLPSTDERDQGRRNSGGILGRGEPGDSCG